VHHLNNFIVEPLRNYSNAIRWHESPYCSHDNNYQHIKYSSKADLFSLQHSYHIASMQHKQYKIIQASYVYQKKILQKDNNDFWLYHKNKRYTAIDNINSMFVSS